jgi:hypothetical protein
MKKQLLTLSLSLVGSSLLAQENLGVNQSNPTAKTHITNTQNQNSFRVDDEAGDATPFVIDSLGNVQTGAKLTTDSLQVTDGASDGAVLTSDANGNATWKGKEMAIYQQRELDGVGGGSSITGFQTRELNFTEFVSGNSISRTGNVITLTPGTYHVIARAPAYSAGHHKLVIRDNNTTNILKIGSNQLANPTTYAITWSFIDAVLVVNTNLDFVLSHWTLTSAPSTGLGFYHGTLDGIEEIYTTVTIEKIK